MAQIHVRRIKAVLRELYQEKIDTTDVKNEGERESHFLTRSQAAYVLSHLADIDHALAADAVVDGYTDNGIDAVYFDRSREDSVIKSG